MSHRASLSAIAASVALAATLLAACGGSTPTGAPSSSAPATAPATAEPTATPPGPTEVPGGDDRTPQPAPGTFQTAWGEAWDALPPGFPMPVDARPADPGDPAAGPASGIFTIGRPPEEVAQEIQTTLATAGYGTEALSGPFEDGSLVVDSVGRDPACRVQTTVRPLSGLVMITVLLGAACPWE